MMKHCHIHGKGRAELGARRAFTLTETLVVIAIIAILLVILFPLYRTFMEKADAAKCVSNLKAYIGSATAYIAENNGELPGTDPGRGVSPFDGNAGAWPYYFRGIPPSTTTIPLCCPASMKNIKKEGVREYPKKQADWRWWYGYNANTLLNWSSGVKGSGGPRAKITQIRTPSKTPYYVDVDMRQSAGANPWGGEMHDNNTTSNYKFWEAHNGGFHIAMLDGHVEWVKFNKDGPYAKGKASGDYPEFTWNPLINN